MSFSNMLEILQEKNKNSIVFIKAGIFYIATGADAVFLGQELKLKCVCFKNQVCKIGIPENRIEHYLRKLEIMGIAYIVYDFDHQKEEIITKYQNGGKYHKEKRSNKNCLICKGIRCYEEDKYLNAIHKYLQEENNK